jgi:O-antigen biosynthesis protein
LGAAFSFHAVAERQAAELAQRVGEADAELARRTAELRQRAAEADVLRGDVARLSAQADALREEASAQKTEFAFVRGRLADMQHTLRRKTEDAHRLTREVGAARTQRTHRMRLMRPARKGLERVWWMLTFQLRKRRRDERRTRSDMRLIGGSGLFDCSWYIGTYPDVPAGEESALRHYVQHGAHNGFDPNPLFDGRWYLDRNPDVRAAGVNPLIHYLQHGASEGRDPSPYFAGSWYLDDNPDVRAAGINPLAHYLRHGAAEGRDPVPCTDADRYSDGKSGIRGLSVLGSPLSDPNFFFGTDAEPRHGRSSVSTAEKWYDEATPEISIIILNWNKSALTIRCLQHVWAHTSGYRYEIMVVDNGSDPEDFAALQGLPGRFRLLRLGVNRFYGEGNNLGAQYANGEFLVFLNNDAFVTPGWLEPLKAAFDIQDDAGAAGAKLVYPDGRLQEAGAQINERGEAVQFGKFQSADDPQYNVVRAVDYCSAACLMVRRSAFEQVLGFDLCWEPAYYEDTDLCFKIALLGLKTYYCPASSVVHLEHGTTADRRTALQLDNIVDINRAKFLQRWGDWLRERRPPDDVVGAARPILPQRSASGPRIGVFTPFSLIPGGGEMYLLSLAESLLPDAEVTLITAEAYSRIRVLTMARELALDLDRLALATLAEARKMPEFDIFVAMSNAVLPPVAGLGRRNMFICQFPFPIERHVIERQWQLWSTYESIVVYSEFARRHVLTSIGRHGLQEKPIHVIAPPVNLVDRRGRKKKSIILSVGRIFTGGHCKRQDLMIEAFGKMLDHGHGATELHIAGALHAEPQHRRYFLRLQEMARGLPVFFHLNASRPRLEELYRDALVYWHAAGIGVDVIRSPEQCEHFGIAIVEAMSAGCIAVVADRGGPAEIVENGRTGFHFRDGAELAAITNHICAERAEPWVADMATAAVDRAQIYAKTSFAQSWRRLLAIDSARRAQRASA